MPHLQLDVPSRCPATMKRNLARRFGELYAEHMQTSADLVHVTFREGEASVWHCRTEADPAPAAVLTLDVRRGRPPEQRAKLAEALVAAACETLGLDPLVMTCEFTQHSGDEIYGHVMIDGVVRGGLAKDWSPAEAQTPLLETIRSDERAKARSNDARTR
jgi:phenylpyruvate tautomerase PptA (4-oxalocrotonate tautomerase family)